MDVERKRFSWALTALILFIVGYITRSVASHFFAGSNLSTFRLLFRVSDVLLYYLTPLCALASLFNKKEPYKWLSIVIVSLYALAALVVGVAVTRLR